MKCWRRMIRFPWDRFHRRQTYELSWKESGRPKGRERGKMGSLNLLAKYTGEMGRKWLPFLCKEHLRQEELTPNPVSSAATKKITWAVAAAGALHFICSHMTRPVDDKPRCPEPLKGKDRCKRCHRAPCSSHTCKDVISLSGHIIGT